MPYFHDINPIAFSIPAFTVRWYHVLTLLAVVLLLFWRAVITQKELAEDRERGIVATIGGVALGLVALIAWMLIKAREFPIGPIGVHWYGIMYLLGFTGAWFLGNWRRRHGRLPVGYEAFSDLAFYVMLGVIVGGRIWYMLSYVSLDWITHDPLALFRVWDGGMSFHGGLLGVLLAVWIWSRRNKVHFFDSIDFVAPLVPIGLGLGRLGNFINGELWGKVTDGPWGVIFPSALEDLNKSREQLREMYLAGQLNHEARHPSQLYEFALEGLVMFGVLYVFSLKPRPRYAVSGLFALMYGVFRFAVEFVRIPDTQLGYLAWGWLTMGQIQSTPLIVIGIVLLWMSRRAPTMQPDPVAANPPPATLKEAA